MKNLPKISVILPVYNAEKYVTEAIQSIIDQTFTNFELLVIDDGSTDTSLEKISNFTDPRIKIIKNEKNLGLIATLNKGFQLSKGEYIARMDADDISLPNRFSTQINFLTKRKDIDILGSQFEIFGMEKQISKLPINSQEIKINLYFESCICHPSVMIRKAFWIENNLNFETKYPHCEDWGLWLKSIEYNANLHNLKDILLKYRLEGQNITLKNKKTEIDRHYNLYASFLKDLFPHLTNDIINIHLAISKGLIKNYKANQIKNYFKQLEKAFLIKGYDLKTIHKVLNKKKEKLFFKITDNSKLESIKYILYNKKIINFNHLRYLLSKIK